MRISPWTFALALIVLPGTSWSQMQEQQFGVYTLRSSTVSSDNLSPEAAREHNIERSPNRAVLNVTVSKEGQTIPAQVDVTGQTLTGKTREIGMKEISVNNYVSYTGNYEFVHGDVIDFNITATPRDSDKTLTMTYSERMWAKGDLPEPATR